LEKNKSKHHHHELPNFWCVQHMANIFRPSCKIFSAELSESFFSVILTWFLKPGLSSFLAISKLNGSYSKLNLLILGLTFAELFLILSSFYFVVYRN
jgi:hypothetical protein